MLLKHVLYDWQYRVRGLDYLMEDILLDTWFVNKTEISLITNQNLAHGIADHTVQGELAEFNQNFHFWLNPVLYCKSAWSGYPPDSSDSFMHHNNGSKGQICRSLMSKWHPCLWDSWIPRHPWASLSCIWVTKAALRQPKEARSHLKSIILQAGVSLSPVIACPGNNRENPRYINKN